MAVELEVNRKRIQRLMRILGIEALYPKPNLSRPAPGHEVYPYLLRGVSIERPNQVWSTDITYIPMRAGFLYLVAIMDWFSRFVLSWELSNTMETGFCLAALEAAFRFGQPEIWNSDQGSQFTSADFLAPLKKRGISISMDGRGRALDNVFIERLWRSLKYELIYPGDFADGAELFAGAGSLLPFLQSPSPAPGARLPHAGRSVPAPVNKEKARHDGGLCPPNPPGFNAFSSRVDGFCFAVIRSCAYNGGLDRRIGQRRDATRAPTQARNGWRPSGRLLDSPPHHLRNGEFLSKQWGPPHTLGRGDSGNHRGTRRFACAGSGAGANRVVGCGGKSQS